MSDVLEASIRALRSVDGESGDAGVTRARVRRSLARRARSHRRLVQSSLIAAVLVVSTLSWALSTGRLSLRTREEPSVPAVPAVIEQPLATPRPMAKRAAKVPAEETWMIPAPAPVAPPVTVAKPKPAPRPTEALYRKAHELHFRGTDLPATLAAWDAYLAAEPVGRFSVEARYNRALVLAKLHRYTEARAALQPYARGEIDGGYRAAEAAPLVERLDQLIELNDPAASGNPQR
jgi:hypothetical protein